MAQFFARDRVLAAGRTHIMAIVNVTPDSFSDGGQFLDPAAALSRAKEAEALGASVLDLGAQSTRPGAVPVSAKEEWARLEPVLTSVLRETALPVSVDTFYPEVAEKAAALGAHILNDVSGFSPEMWRVAAKYGCGCIVMHPGDPVDTAGGGEDVLLRVRRFFEEKRKEAASFGIPAERLCFDPGIGFGKSQTENLRLLANPEALRVPGTSLLFGASRKRVAAFAAGNPEAAPQDRLAGTLALHTGAALFGADILRAHDIRDAVEAAHAADALRAARETAVCLDTVRIRGLEIFAYHGVNPEEKRDGQPFLLDIAMRADLRRAGETDDLIDTVNYAAVRKAVQKAFTAEKYDLIERAASVVCGAVLENFPAVREITVEVKKPFAPMNAKFDYVSVEMTRRRA